MRATQHVIKMRVSNGLGVARAFIQTLTSNGKHFISVELPGVKDLQKAESLLQQTGQLTLIANKTTDLQPGQSTKGYQVLARGTDINADSVQAGTDQTTGGAVVDLTVNSAAANRIATYTAQYAGTGFMAVALDGKVYSDPTVQQAIPNGQIQITVGSGGIPAANDLAAMLRYGALPVPLTIVRIVIVDQRVPRRRPASLGSRRTGMTAASTTCWTAYLAPSMHHWFMSKPYTMSEAALLLYWG